MFIVYEIKSKSLSKIKLFSKNAYDGEKKEFLINSYPNLGSFLTRSLSL